MTEEQLKGMHSICPTVRIKAGDSYVILNEHDYDPAMHTKLEDTEPARHAPPPSTGSASSPMAEGKKKKERGT